MEALNHYGEKLAKTALQQIPNGVYSFSDHMDDDGKDENAIAINLSLTITDTDIVADFSGTSAQVDGNINCPLSVTAAAVFYVFRCLMPDQTPACAGIFRLIKIKADAGSLVNAEYPAAVVAGNVETSSRLVDVTLGALQKALPEKIPAASQGTMNNIAMGYRSEENDGFSWDYYETLAGGTGGGPRHNGLSAVHSHMTNTLNTPVESLELHYPIRIHSYSIREGSGGLGMHPGGNGLSRVYEFLLPTHVSLLTERRVSAPWGLAGGAQAEIGVNLLDDQPLAAKCSFTASPGQYLSILTPGGGGWGNSISSEPEIG